jgi:hypothetical protein
MLSRPFACKGFGRGDLSSDARLLMSLAVVRIGEEVRLDLERVGLLDVYRLLRWLAQSADY